jgi:hypothetical protein
VCGLQYFSLAKMNLLIPVTILFLCFVVSEANNYLAKTPINSWQKYACVPENIKVSILR